jgi:hypothetical protein
MRHDNIALLVSIIIPIASALGTLIPVLSANFNNRKAIIEKLDAVAMDINRLIMHDEHISLEERIMSGDRYIKAGGNGASKVYQQQLVEEYQKQLKKIIADGGMI